MSLPQREGRPSLDLKPEESTSLSKDWTDPVGGDNCKDNYDNLGANDRNNPVKVRKGGPEANGWTKEAFDTNQTDSV